MGCATDRQKAVMALTSKSTSSTSMSVDTCATFCAGSQYYGLEYAAECYCGNTLNAPNFITNTTSVPKSSICNMRCSGRGDQLCGGPNAISLYKNTAYVAPQIKNQIGSFSSKGCITDPSGGSRTLNETSFASDTMTADSCVKYCLGKRMQYAGVEYGRECYCANKINTAGGAKSVACNTNNLMLCAGNKLQYCGAGSLLNLYYAASF